MARPKKLTDEQRAMRKKLANQKYWERNKDKYNGGSGYDSAGSHRQSHYRKSQSMFGSHGYTQQTWQDITRKAGKKW